MPTFERSRSTPDDADAAITLGVLSAVEFDPRVTQRRLSSELGIALGLTNAYLKRCVRKGWVKIGQVPMRRYAYYLTPQGFGEKARLTGEYLAWSLEFFRKARREATTLFSAARERGLTRFVLIGAGDMAEVVILSAIDAEVEIIGVLDPDASLDRCVGKPVFRSAVDLVKYTQQHAIVVDALMVTATETPVAAFNLARSAAVEIGVPVSKDRILIPSVFKILWPTAPVAEETAQ